MTVYKRCLLELSKQSSFKSIHNNLMKLYYETEDYTLKDYIRRYAEGLAEAEKYRISKLISHCSSVLHQIEPIKVSLINYCSDMESLRKPEWQILAERYGWTPPRK